MKTTRLFIYLHLLLTLAFGAIGCSSKDDESSEADMLHPGDHVTLYSNGKITVKAIYEPISYNDAPEWIKTILNEKDRFGYIYIYEGERKNETIYLICTEFDSTIGTFLNKNGEKLAMNNISYSDFFSESFNWKLIFYNKE